MTPHMPLTQFHPRENMNKKNSNPLPKAFDGLAEAYAKAPTFYECGICGSYHPATWDGDCRDDANRFALGELDEKYGPFGWSEIPMPD